MGGPCSWAPWLAVSLALAVSLQAGPALASAEISPRLHAFNSVFFVRTGELQSEQSEAFQRVLGIMRRTGTPSTAAGMRNLTDSELMSVAFWSAAGRSAPYMLQQLAGEARVVVDAKTGEFSLDDGTEQIEANLYIAIIIVLLTVLAQQQLRSRPEQDPSQR